RWRRGKRSARCAARSSSLDLDSRAGLLELRLGRLGVLLGHGLLHGGGRRLDLVLGLLEAKTGELTHGLDDVDLLRAGILEDDVELGLLFGCFGRTGGR